MKEKFTIEIWKEEEGQWLAEICLDSAKWMTQGCNEEEIWDMIADSVLCIKDEPTFWWNRWLKKLLIYFKN